MLEESCRGGRESKDPPRDMFSTSSALSLRTDRMLGDIIRGDRAGPGDLGGIKPLPSDLVDVLDSIVSVLCGRVGGMLCAGPYLVPGVLGVASSTRVSTGGSIGSGDAARGMLK